MRRIAIFDNISADGYFATTDGKLDWVVQDPEIHRASIADHPQFDTVLFGRRTYDLFESFWPHALDGSDTAPNPHSAHRDREMRAMATMLNEATKWVFSRTRPQTAWRGAHLIRELDPRAIETMKRAPGKDMIVFGSGSIVSQLAQHGLIDEYQLVVNPILLGAGRSLTAALAQIVRLRLVDARPFPSGNVVLRYAPASAG